MGEKEVDEIDELFGNTDYGRSTKKKSSKTSSLNGSPMNLKKSAPKQDMGSLDDFLSSFQDDLNKHETSSPTSKVITKTKREKKKKKKSKSSTKEKKSKSKDAGDDFFDDW